MRPAHERYLSEFNRAHVYRASALFWVAEDDDLHSSIEFLQYWGFKHHTAEVGLVVTLRDLHGSVVARRAETLSTTRAHSVATADLLRDVGAGGPFEGCVEIELFAAREIRFAYPALLALYHGQGWQSVVHTYSRTYASSSGDGIGLITEARRAEESNFSVCDDGEHESFCVLHNGPFAVPAEELELSVFNAAGDERRAKVMLSPRPPAATTRIVLGEHVTALATYLDGRPGFAVLRWPVRGVFPRLLAGHRRRRDGALLGMTHSHHDSRGAIDVFAIPATPPALRPMFISVPVGGRGAPWSAEVTAYPTTMLMDAAIDVRWLSADGRPLRHDRDVTRLRRGDAVRRAESLLPPGPGDAVVADVTLRPDTPSIATRYHLGVTLRGAGLHAPFTTGFAPFCKPRYHTYWFPLLNLPGRRDHVAVINTDSDPTQLAGCELSVSLYRARDAGALEGTLRLPPDGAFVAPSELIIDGSREFLGHDRGWCVLRSARAMNLHLFYACVDERTAVVAADHGF